MTKKYSIIFCGTPEFAAAHLLALVDNPAFDVQLVISQPDRPVGRKQVLTAPPVKTLALSYHIPVLQPESLNAEFSALKLPKVDFLIVVAYGQILSQQVLDHPSVVPVNVHASLLPQLRGASPIQHAILHNLPKTGITIQKMVKELDAGPVLSQESIQITPRETSETLHDRLMNLGSDLLMRTLKQSLKLIEQDPSQATFCTKLSRADGVVDENAMTAEEIDRRVRALNPWPGVTWNDAKILKTELELVDGSFELVCKDGTKLYITKIQPAGKKAMTGAEFGRGLR